MMKTRKVIMNLKSINKDADIKIAQLNDFLNFHYTQLKQSEQKIIQIPLYPPLKLPKVKRLYVDGVFDLTHSGHFNAIRQAKQLCETLVLGVVSQEEVLKRKGPPVLNYEERVGIARACKWVDEIFENAPYDPSLELLDQLNCSHVAHGDDMILLPDGRDQYWEFKEKGRFVMFKRTEGISTTDIVGRLLLMTKTEPSLNIKKIRKMSGEQGLEANGSFDMIHIGHISTLQKAKEFGNYLIVGLHDDDVISDKKGNSFPILSLQERVLSILAIKYVDEVIIGAPWDINTTKIQEI
ncbi:hypothetical protein IMG5_126990 [Ichthyophthirius multifiliis]|uniref:ethanolamine-phosphate cytidylyltransferase n=1 Tax=Ichthyophthirius multifiliis TaxID=5932 RepID=G0QVV5_ICHMU|nr:hypothetical protein IMG5_126990 [Ichthyophthirius multifiliis]EGR30650.1 hypothetical protein IMG5_126990 [Ichthyophthirius multifiliis]|eukprot:XP_004032237.1 hypothetical protein IMG5_126990 [Ichthyophthirius multifiliis]